MWFIFVFSYAGRVAEGRTGFAWLLGAALVGLALRIAARVRRR
jgi:hypothetical protein